MTRTQAIEVTAIAIGAVLLLASIAAAAETYRWVDAEGKVHYSDQPRVGAEEVQIRVPEADTPPAPGSPEATAQAVRAEHCALARKRLDEYENSDTLVQQDEFGRERPIEGEERVQYIARARGDVRVFCGEQATGQGAGPVTGNAAPGISPQAAGPAVAGETPAPTPGAGY